jgi:hypothetical protein
VRIVSIGGGVISAGGALGAAHGNRAANEPLHCGCPNTLTARVRMVLIARVSVLS